MANDETVRGPVEVASDVDLLVCPFCASTNVSFYEHVYAQTFAVKCNLCGAEGPSRAAHEEAARPWNRRVQA
jgi:Lar family restriction alleviation protein